MARENRNRDWRQLVEDVLAGLNGTEFTKEWFVGKCSDLAWDRYDTLWVCPEDQKSDEVRGPSRSYYPGMVSWGKFAGRRFPYVGEKVIPWLLGAHRGRQFSRLDTQRVTHGGFVTTMNGILGDKNGRHWVEWQRGGRRYGDSFVTPHRMTRVCPAVAGRNVDVTRCPLKIKVLTVPHPVLDAKAPHFEDLLALVRGNWRIAGDYLQDRDIDQQLGTLLAQDEELSALFGWMVLRAAVSGPVRHGTMGELEVLVTDARTRYYEMVGGAFGDDARSMELW